MKKHSVILSAMFLLLVSCAPTPPIKNGVQVEGVRNPSIHLIVDNTRKLPTTGTFGWGFSMFRVANRAELNLSTIDKRLHDALRETLVQKGFKQVEDQPDYIVSYAVADSAGIDEMMLNQAHDGAALSLPTVSGDKQPPLHYLRGALVVDIVDAKTKRLLWRGAILGDVEKNVSTEQKQARCREAVGALLAHFPKP